MRPLLLCLMGLFTMVPALAQSNDTNQRRLLRIESRVYGWYGVAEPSFDKTLGRRELFKINDGEKFLKGLEGRLVILEGRFSEGQLDLGALAPPPITVAENARRQRFVVDRSLTSNGVLTSADGVRLHTTDATLSQPGGGQWNLDLVVTPLAGNDWSIIKELARQESVTQPVTSDPLPPTAASLAGGALMELEMTQEIIDNLVDLGRDQAGLKVDWQSLSLKASELRLILPDGTGGADAPWRLEGTVEFGLAQVQGALAESSFVISARPLIANNTLLLEPNWDEIKLEGQLPFAFLLDASMLQQLKAYLPQQLTVLNLEWVSDSMRAQGLLAAEDQVDWYLAPSGPGTLRLGLGPKGTQVVSAPSQSLRPGNFRLKLAAPVADRLVRRGVQATLDPNTPFVPDPPIQVGKALFVAIKVEQIFLRSLESGYSNGVFRFRNLVIDVAWKAGPLSGVEPLLRADGFIRPRLSAPLASGPRHWDWDLKIEQLTIRSDKLPGDKEKLAAELIPRLESELGRSLAQKQKIPAVLPLSSLIKTGASANAAIEIVELRPLDALLELEGRLIR